MKGKKRNQEEIEGKQERRKKTTEPLDEYLTFLIYVLSIWEDILRLLCLVEHFNNFFFLNVPEELNLDVIRT